MKKSLLVLASFSALSTVAHAQSSVTLYGLIDVGITYANNAGGHSQYQMSSGNIQGSRWGLRGTEDLGSGLKALFVLENGFSVATGKLGQGGDEFGRQAYVGLSSASAGTVTFGRQYDSIADFTGVFEVADQWSPYFGAHPGDLDNMNNTNRVNNAIKYKSLNYNGFSFGGMYSLGGVAGQFSRNQIWSLGAGYLNGPLALGVAYVNVKDPNYSYFGNNSTSSTTASNMTASRVYSGYASAKTQQIFTAGGAYTFGAATFGATYSNTQFKDIGAETGLPATGSGGNAKFHNVEVNFKYQITPSFLAGAAYDYTKGYGVNDATYHQGVLGLDYFLSKRTDVYIDGVYQHASGTDSTGGRAVANINFLSASTTQNQVLAIVGMRHKF
ncbi:Outer membrane protein (porin) [Paraburkholderia fungorum]|uniref:Outer membrane protein (Porin) n=1 Tax=Paraburkholderia fungorum TaxID=134537 RepID=A0A1H1IQG7_9BURK|nr:porin [Paraburkholderia fungorum]SDR39558.1 Outer membrane protein (porin) [Paraburkholderia fungorum]